MKVYYLTERYDEDHEERVGRLYDSRDKLISSVKHDYSKDRVVVHDTCIEVTETEMTTGIFGATPHYPLLVSFDIHEEEVL